MANGQGLKLIEPLRSLYKVCSWPAILIKPLAKLTVE